ncbi:hypothetical protein L21SP4_00603 [Kiritimatiella glycovorans]|uniref:Uncharacterized protein n=1 Tax=Kiritimatiella glycovorans TaxID=1307763 RepID=A0A0G3EC66_9BACT|nr:hypothetical protein L21SP4_00603 [Kiritimatiella glycovorans]
MAEEHEGVNIILTLTRTRTRTRSAEGAILYPIQEIEHEYRFAEHEYAYVVTQADF